MTDWALELAENANTWTPLRPADDRIVTDRFVLWMGHGDDWNVAQRFRFAAAELDEVRAEIHAAVRARGRRTVMWEVGSHAEPAGLVERLERLGLEVTEHQVGMVLDRPPAQTAPGVEVRRVTTAEENAASERIAAVAFGGEALPPDDFEPDPENVVYLAYVDGVPVSRASASFSEHGVTLFGGATLPEGRGRGAYRALVAARWEDAVARGMPFLVTQASPMSRPILARLGFREVCTITALSDRV